jgi:hypothetical protein
MFVRVMVLTRHSVFFIPADPSKSFACLCFSNNLTGLQTSLSKIEFFFVNLIWVQDLAVNKRGCMKVTEL